jgi:hypothetical protein
VFENWNRGSALLSQEGSGISKRIRHQEKAGGSKAPLLHSFASEPPRRFAPPLLTQEGNFQDSTSSRIAYRGVILTFNPGAQFLNSSV